MIELKVTSFFSPNGDGVQDRVIVRYILPKASDDVTLTVTYRHWTHTGRKVLVLHPGGQEAGKHLWTWDGRRGNGEPAQDAEYTVGVTAIYRRGPVTASHRIVLDTRFVPPAIFAERYGAPRSEPNKVYPRSSVVVDALPLRAVTERLLPPPSRVDATP